MNAEVITSGHMSMACKSIMHAQVMMTSQKEWVWFDDSMFSWNALLVNMPLLLWI
jgi:hypothetical protein